MINASLGKLVVATAASGWLLLCHDVQASERETLQAALAAAMTGSQTPALAVLPIHGFRAGTEAVRGRRRLGSPDEVRPGDRWHLGSDSKAMTATLLARLVEQGCLSWDASLEEMLPELAEAIQAQYRDATLVDLLSHRSGLPENLGDDAVFESMHAGNGTLTQKRQAYVAAALREAPVGPARAARHYSNTGYIVAAAVAERATGQSFEQLMQAEVFKPLGMRSATFSQFGTSGEPSGHVDGRVADKPRDANPAMFTPAGGGRMSLVDWARFCIDAMRGAQGKGRLLRGETYRFLQTAQGQGTAGLGWGVKDSLMGQQGPVLTHTGSDGNWYALVALFPRSGDGVLVTANAAESMQGDKAALTALREAISAMRSRSD
jgi:CubicO group peptidase (beta-lactamase class C family)